jgi:DegV family protein with EDD domain
MTIKIVTDSTCDLPDPIIQELGITVVPLYINLGDKGYLDGVELSREEFYTRLPDYPSHPTTGTPGLEVFRQAYQAVSSNGADQILSIHISESLSATAEVAKTASRDFTQTPVTVRDSRQLSLGTGFQLEAAARMVKEGKSMDEILAALDSIMRRTFVAAGLNTLEYLRRSGRMNAFMTGLGSLLQLKPILTMKDGQPDSERVRTSEKAEARLVKMLKAHWPLEKFALLHTHAAQKAEAFRERIAEYLPQGDVYSVDITPVIGAHIGPGAVGYAIVSSPTS